MQLYSDLKYIGDKYNLKVYGDIWHCTCCATNYNTGAMEYIMQPPYYHDGQFMGYTGLDAVIVTEEELEKNFKIINKDDTLTGITHDEGKERQDKKRN